MQSQEAKLKLIFFWKNSYISRFPAFGNYRILKLHDSVLGPPAHGWVPSDTLARNDVTIYIPDIIMYVYNSYIHS